VNVRGQVRRVVEFQVVKVEFVVMKGVGSVVWWGQKRATKAHLSEIQRPADTDQQKIQSSTRVVVGRRGEECVGPHWRLLLGAESGWEAELAWSVGVRGPMYIGKMCFRGISLLTVAQSNWTAKTRKSWSFFSRTKRND